MRAIKLALVLALSVSHSASGAAQDDAAALVSRLGLEESAQRVDARTGWRVPRKIIVRAEPFVSFPGIAWLQAVAPGVRIVAAHSLSAAVAEAADADAVIGWCDSALLDAGRDILWIQFIYAGVERCVSEPALRDRDVLLTNMQKVQSAVIAEHAIAMMMALSRALDLGMQHQQRADWRPDALLGSGRLRTIEGRTLLVAGLGGIGTEVARRAHALGTRVIATRASGRDGPDFVSYVGLPDELPTLAAEADVVVNALPLTAATRGLFDAGLFAAMKRDALFLNVGRGGTVDTPSLVAALTDGRIAGAGLDVTEPEPLPPDHPLWRAPNVIITPHISSESEIGFSRVWLVVRENLRRYVAGERMLSVVDVERGY